MRKRRRWLPLVVLLLVGAGTLAALLEPTRTVRGLLAGEPFFRGRSASSWREVLREQGRNGRIPAATVRQFRFHGNEAFGVLRQCAGDPDRNVRWPAIALMRESDLRTQPVLEVLMSALDDPGLAVRLQAIDTLAGWGPMARQAVPALIARLEDPELQAAHFADLALWRIDVPAALTADGWRPFTSSEWGFSVMLPGEPEGAERPPADNGAVAHSFQCWHRAGTNQMPTRYVVAVVEAPESALKGATDEERLEAMKNCVPVFFAGGDVVEDKRVSLNGLPGRELVIEIKGTGRLRSWHFWVGRRLYAVHLAYKPEFLNEPAATYFLDSFRVEKQTDTPTRPGAERPSGSAP
jgi:hypothetical protein